MLTVGSEIREIIKMRIPTKYQQRYRIIHHRHAASLAAYVDLNLARISICVRGETCVAVRFWFK